MKVLIVDDEKPVRESINLLTDWNKYCIDTVLEADNGNHAIELIKTFVPELILTDIRMPSVNGLELIDWIRRNYPEIKIIVISGYSDYAYVHEAMKNGALDYLLKPIAPDALDESIHNAIKAVLENNIDSERTAQYDFYVHEFNKTLLQKYLDNLPEHSNEDFDISTFSPFGIGLLDLSFASGLKTSCLNNECCEKCDELQDQCINAIRLILKNDTIGTVIQSKTRSNIYYVMVYDDLHHRINAIFLEIKDVLTPILGYLPFLIHSKNIIHDSCSLSSCANNLMQKLFSHPLYITQNKFLSQKSLPPFYNSSVLLALRSENERIVSATLEQYLEAFSFAQCLTLRDLRDWRADYIVSYKKYCREFGLLNILEIDNQILKISLMPMGILGADGMLKPKLLKSLLLHDLSVLVEISIHQNTQPEKFLCKHIAMYIEDNFASDISLQSLSMIFDRNPSYLSRKFSDEMEITIVEYIRTVRIRRANILLNNPQLKISEISPMVGYIDEKYFSRVYKQSTGYSPADYRKYLLAQHSDNVSSYSIEL